MGRVLAGLLLAVLGALAVPVGIGAGPAHACSCAMATLADQAKGADVAFVGTVDADSVDQKPGRSIEPISFTVDVDEVYAGDVGSTAAMQTQSYSASCGLGQVPEGRMIWFSHLNEGAATDRRLNVGLCTPPVPASAANLAEVEEAIGAAHAVQGAGSPSASAEVTPEAGADEREASDAAESSVDLAAWWPLGVAVIVVLGAAGGLVWSRSQVRRS